VPPAVKRRCFLHVGTHKTGTTTLQRYASEHERLLDARGVYYPRSGRVGAGHHNLAWELYGARSFQRSAGDLAALKAELQSVSAPTVLLSSEDFECAYDRPTQLNALVRTITDAGFDPVVVLDVRPQADYIESLYSTYTVAIEQVQCFRRGPATSFEQFYREILATGRYGVLASTSFSYDILADRFARIVGRRRVVVRPYWYRSPEDLLRKWLLLLLGSVDAELEETVRSAEWSNRRSTYREIAAALHQDLGPADLDALKRIGSHTFRAFDVADLLAVSARFGSHNIRLALRYGVRLPTASPQRVLAALRDRRSSHTRRLQEALRFTPPRTTLDEMADVRVRSFLQPAITKSERAIAEPHAILGAVDSIEDERTRVKYAGTILASATSRITIEGWSYIPGSGPALISVLLDGRIVAFGTPAVRPDLAAEFGASAVTSGFRVILPPLPSGLGRCELEIVAQVPGDDVKTLLAQRRVITVDPAAAIPVSTLHIDPPICLGLELDGDATVSWYDTPRLRGWGFDDTSRARFADAAFLVDGSVISCSYGLGRPDVARAFSLHDADVGLEADVLLDFLPEGTHEVRAVALSGDGATVISEGSRLITVRSDERARRPRTAHLAR
jgi:hypothetical protein